MTELRETESPSAHDPAPGSPPFLVAGIGASAGGLEAFTRVLQAIPGGTPLALVLVQHLARDHESLLPKLLSAKTELTVEEGRDGQRLAPGHVYVILPNTHMAVVDGCLSVRPRPPGRQHDVPVDHLFESMAEQYRERALGVVLSGGGSDGAFGVQRIHGVGGIVLAQEPTEALMDSMPRAVIATGSVDKVLASERIAAELVRLAQHPFYQQVSGTEVTAGEAAEEALQPILAILRRSTGVDFARYKTPTITRRIQRRMAIHHLHEVPAYVDYLNKHPGEAACLHDDILIHVTSFFREPESFEALKQDVLPKLIEANLGDGPVRAWVPGCSSGEEAYSLAITLLESMAEMKQAVPIVVFGTDLSQRMIEHARSGLYSESIASEVTPEQLRRYFVKVDNGYRVSSDVRERCVFARQDITRDPPFSKLDIVMCRNLLIYLKQSAQRKLIGVFHYALLPHGALVLGRSETIGPLPELFSVTDNRWKIYHRKPGILPLERVVFGVQPPELQTNPASRFARIPTRDRRDRELQDDASRVLLERYSPPFVIVDDAFRVVRSQGRTAPYLELPSGEASLDLLKMARPGLMPALRSALQEARISGDAVRKEGLDVRGEDIHCRVNVEVSRMGDASNPRFLVLFEDATAPSAGAVRSRKLARTSHDATVEQLEAELNETRASLQSMIQELEAANEELQAANEEILSSNEELQSTNEELDTAREELQATNEELGTVNEELQSRNGELSRANGDLVNLLASVEIPIVMVTSDLKIRRFTPAAERTLNLIASDVGRPIGHIKPNIGFPDLEAVLREVIDKMVIREREVEDQDGRRYIATVRAYRSVSHRIDGAVLALFDVSDSLKLARDTGEALMSTIQDPILMLDSNLTVRRANGAFFRTFRVSATETEGRSLFELSGGQWSIEPLRRLLQEVLPLRRNFDGFVVRHEFSEAGFKHLLVDARRITSGRGDGVILLIIREQVDVPR